MNKSLKTIIIIIAIFICVPLIVVGLDIIFHFISIPFEMNEEEAEKIVEEAKNKKDVEVCYKIGKVRGNLNIRYMCITEVAVETKNESLCEKIPSVGTNWKGACYSKISKSKNDVSICEKIENEVEKNICYFDVAIETNNSELCKRVGYKQLPDADQCFYKIAINTLNQELCDQLQDYENKMDCIKEVKVKRFPPDTKPDLIISDIKIPTSVWNGGIDFGVEIKNIGDKPTKDVRVTAITKKEGKVSKEDEICFEKWIFPGETRSFDSFSTPLTKESPNVTIIVKVDSKNLIEEIDENNNEKILKTDYFEAIKRW